MRNEDIFGRRYGLKCTNVCASYNGETCLNSTSKVGADEDDMEEVVLMY